MSSVLEIRALNSRGGLSFLLTENSGSGLAIAFPDGRVGLLLGGGSVGRWREAFQFNGDLG